MFGSWFCCPWGTDVPWINDHLISICKYGSNLEDINDIYDQSCRVTQIRDWCHGCGVSNDIKNHRMPNCGFKRVGVEFFRLLFWPSQWWHLEVSELAWRSDRPAVYFTRSNYYFWDLIRSFARRHGVSCSCGHPQFSYLIHREIETFCLSEHIPDVPIHQKRMIKGRKFFTTCHAVGSISYIIIINNPILQRRSRACSYFYLVQPPPRSPLKIYEIRPLRMRLGWMIISMLSNQSRKNFILWRKAPSQILCK